VPEKVVSTLSATKAVAVQAQPLQSQTLKRSSSCGAVLQASTDRSHKNAQETHLSTVPSFVGFVKTRTRAGYYMDLILMCKERFYLGRAQDDFTPCIKEDGRGLWKRIKEETNFRVHKLTIVSDQTDHMQGKFPTIEPTTHVLFNGDFMHVLGQHRALAERQQDIKCINCSAENDPIYLTWISHVVGHAGLGHATLITGPTTQVVAAFFHNASTVPIHVE